MGALNEGGIALMMFQAAVHNHQLRRHVEDLVQRWADEQRLELDRSEIGAFADELLDLLEERDETVASPICRLVVGLYRAGCRRFGGP